MSIPVGFNINAGAVPIGYKRCGTCQSILEESTDNFHRNGKQGWCHYCKVCIRVKDSTPERMKQKAQYTATRRNKPGQREQRTEYFASDDYKAVKRKYLQSPKGMVKSRLHTRRRRVLALQLIDAFTTHHWQQALDYFGGCCAACGRPEGDGRILSPDHWIPITSEVCPGTVPTNIVPLCHSRTKGSKSGCNNSKNNREARSWLEWKFGNAHADVVIAQVQRYFEWVNYD